MIDQVMINRIQNKLDIDLYEDYSPEVQEEVEFLVDTILDLIKKVEGWDC